MKIEKVICVLGMHRSGTSCLTGSLEQAGVFLGNVSRKNPHNLKGNYENPRIMELHERLLEYNGGSWKSPPATISWPQPLQQLRDEIIQEYQPQPCWGFKDPRTLLTLDGWLEVLPGLTLVAIFRHPLLVAQSLHARNREISINEGITLWDIYNQRLFSYHERFSFPIISFDSDANTFKKKLIQLFHNVNLLISGEKITFFEPNLKNQTTLPESFELPPETRTLYQQLQELAI